MDLEKIEQKQQRSFFIGILIFAFFSKIIAALLYYNEFDTFWYLGWAKEMQTGFFNAYNYVKNLDYPPLYLYPLYVVGAIYKSEMVAESKLLTMLLLKIIPIIFDVLCSVFLYKIVAKKNAFFALAVACLWLFNPSIFFNSSFWGQTDSIMILELLVAFWLFEKKKPVLGCIIYTIAALTKLQVLFFAPIVFYELLFSADMKKIIKSALLSVAVFIGVFAPFMLFSGLKLPLNVYAGGAGSYPYGNLNSFNLYGLFDLNFKPDNVQILPFLTLHHLSLILTLTIVVLIFYIYWRAKTPSIWLTTFVLIQCLFMLTTRMHERYQIVAVPLILMAYIKMKDIRLFYIFVGTSIITFCNQALLLIKVNHGNADFNNAWNSILFVFSAINLVLFVYSLYVSFKILLQEKEVKTIEEE